MAFIGFWWYDGHPKRFKQVASVATLRGTDGWRDDEDADAISIRKDVL